MLQPLQELAYCHHGGQELSQNRPRRFYHKGRRTRHIQAKHPDSGSEPLSPAGPAAYPAPISPLAQQSFRGSSSIPSNFTPPLLPSQYGFDANTNMDREIDPDPDPPHVTRTSHPKLDGMSIFFFRYT